jgi:hypothetical protein
LHRCRSNFQYLRNLLQGEPGKEAQFYNSALTRVDFGKTYKSIIEGYDFYVFSGGRHRPFVEGELADTVTAFRRTVAAGIVDKNLTHKLGGYGKEMSAALPLQTPHPDQSKIRLMNQRGALQGVVWPFVPQLKVGQTPQFFVDQGKQRVECLSVTAPPYLQQLRDLAWRLVLHRGSLEWERPCGRSLAVLKSPVKCEKPCKSTG